MCAVLLASLSLSDLLRPHGLQPARLLCPSGFSRQKYWNGLLGLPPGDLPNPGSKPRSPHYRQILYWLSHQRSPRILELVAYPFSRGSSWPQNGVSYIAGGFFTGWATCPLYFVIVYIWLLENSRMSFALTVKCKSFFFCLWHVPKSSFDHQ